MFWNVLDKEKIMENPRNRTEVVNLFISNTGYKTVK